MKENLIFSAAGAVVMLVIIFIIFNVMARIKRDDVEDARNMVVRNYSNFQIPTFFGRLGIVKGFVTAEYNF